MRTASILSASAIIWALNGTDGPCLRAEVAFAIADALQGQGIGTLLLEHLAAIARANGIEEFEAYVLGENNRMLQVFETSGFRIQRSIDTGVFHVSFPTAGDGPGAQPRESTGSVWRQPRACAPSCTHAPSPSWGPRDGLAPSAHPLLANLRHYGFTGPIYPVNPHAREFDGLPAFPTVSAIGAPVDLALIAVPAPAVENVVADCARAGVRGVVVISSGFAEVSEAGRQAEQRLRDLVRASGMRLVGPNCMGLLNTAPEVSLNATFAPTLATGGQHWYALAERCAWPGRPRLCQRPQCGHLDLYLRWQQGRCVGNDLLAYWAEDPHTDVIVFYLESFGNPRKFARIGPRGGAAEAYCGSQIRAFGAGTRAASSHSAALANLDVAVDALFTQAG